MKYTWNKMINRVKLLNEDDNNNEAKEFLFSIMDRSVDATSLPQYMGDITCIDKYAFVGCTNLGLTSLPNSITHINERGFASCTSLELSMLPSNIIYIGEAAFTGCSKLSLTSLPSSLDCIEVFAFCKCINLTNLTFEGTPSFIGYSAFDGCTNLTTINVPWSEGEVANAPWGATNATINYDYVEPTE